ncbi:Calreticulin-1 [Basidiobolus ranarum]|uniref:Calreticulin n=1 Tax=Basidiobolus ranarum TaxID=34480 RepID=A0ABR2WBP0_9FUNG
MKATVLLGSLLALAAASAEVFFEETFDGNWADRWVPSKVKEDLGIFDVSAGKFFADSEVSKGLQTTQDARFYALSAPMDKTFSNKDKDFVVQFSVKHEQNIDCGGGYLKVLPPGVDLEKFDGETKYNVMFGPDICGPDRKVHVILNHNNVNHLIKKPIIPPSDQMTHLYTLIIKPDLTYSVLIDNKEEATGGLLEDWDILPPKTIKDPEAKKPEDWVDNATIPDPEDKKPEGYDDIQALIADPEAKKPEDWDDEDDGEWESPMIDNPDYNGPWEPKTIPNPDYKGPWVHPEIPNPEYKEDKDLYVYESGNVAFDLWQVKAGTIFDNILITDDAAYAKEFAEKTFGKYQEAEKEAKEKFDEVEKKKQEEEEAKLAAEAEAEAENEEVEELDADKEVTEESKSADEIVVETVTPVPEEPVKEKEAIKDEL